jgi:hypothetical protein
VWSYNATWGALSVVPPGGGAAQCLTAPTPPPPPPAWVALTLRAPPYPNNGPRTYSGYSLRVQEGGQWAVMTGRTSALANGTLGGGAFNSSAPHVLKITAAGTTVSAWVDGAALWSGSDATYAMGQVALGSGYHAAAFDDFSVAPAAGL